MRCALAFFVWWLLVSAASATPCIVFDPNGQPYSCGVGFFDINSTAVHVNDPIVLTASLAAVEPVTNFSFLFLGSFNITSSQAISDLGYVFNGYFSQAGESDILAFFTDGYGNPDAADRVRGDWVCELSKASNFDLDAPPPL